MEPKKSKWCEITKENDFKRFLESYKKKEKNRSYIDPTTAEEAIETFGSWMKQKGYAHETILKKKCKVRCFFKDTKLELQEITIEIRKAHKEYLLNLIAAEKRKKNYVSSILTDLNVFFCNYLQREDLRVPGIGKEEVYYDRLTREEFNQMIAEVEKRNDIDIKKKKLHKVLLIFFWNELPRTSEGTLNIKLGDVKIQQREILLRSGKRNKVPMHLRTPLATQEFLDAWEEYKDCRDSDDWSDDAPAFVQTGSGGRSVSPKFMQRLVKEYAVRAGITKRVFPYLFRKSGGTEIAMKNPKLAQIQLGHSSVKTTLTNYVIPNKEDKKTIEQYLNPDRSIMPEKIATELAKRYLKCNATDEREMIFALRALKKAADEKNRKGDYDVAFS